MLRWCLVRALGGYDSNPRFSSHFSSRTLPLSWPRFSRAHANAAVPVVDLVEEPGVSVAVASPTSHRDASHLSSAPSTRPSEDCHHARVASFRASHSAIDALRRYLSSENVASDQPLLHSPATIRSLYYCAESRNQLGMLDSRMLTLLIGMFGSLSIDPRMSVLHRVPSSRLLRVSTRRSYWSFVLKVGRYKLKSGMSLQDSDRFWLMYAELAIVQAKPILKPLPYDAYSAILRARRHYHIIRRHSRRPELHAHYLETLLAIQDPRLLDFVAYDLSFLLRTHRMCHPWLQRLLYRLVVQHGAFLPTQSQDAILAALWSRVCQETNTASDPVPENGLSDVTLDDRVLDATAMARLLSATLFGPSGQLSNGRSANSIGHLLSVFSPTYAHALRWSSLFFFSIFNSSGLLHSNGTLWTSDRAMSRVTSCWQVIFGLATVEKVLGELPPALAIQSIPAEEVLETTHNLYQSWLSTMSSCLVSRDLACAIAGSFLKIASILADAALFYDCQHLYRPDSSSGGLLTSAQKFFAAQYIAAGVRVHGPLSNMVSAALEGFFSDSKQRHQILASAVEALASIDASLANTFYAVVRGKGMEPDSRATHTLAMSFAKHGALRQAILLNDGRFSPENQGILVSVIARNLRENPRTRHPQSVIVAIADELAALYRSHVPPKHFRGHLEQLFVVLTEHGRGSQLLPVVLSIFRRLPSFFQPRFFDRYCRVLIRRRQFATAGKLLDSITAVHPKVTRSLSILVDRALLRAEAFRVLKLVAPLRGPTLLRPPPRPCRLYAGPPLERSLQELLRSGRLLVAKHIFGCAAATVSSARCTTLGNILLHGVSRQPTPHNGRRVRKVLTLLEKLAKNHGFQPDRVTANILVKVMTNWRSKFDSPQLRELFDQFVRGGYPAADYSPLHLPFGTHETPFLGLSGFSKFLPSVSFEKHSRPLFKMFIKAFYSCNDVEAARKVVEILKVEEYKNIVAKQARQRARTRGRIKAAQRNVISLGAAAPSID